MTKTSLLSIAFCITTTIATTKAEANKWDELVACPAKWSFIYADYVATLEFGKAMHVLHDRLHAHGLLNDFIAGRNNELFDLLKDVPVAGDIVFVVRNADARCLKAGVDFVFDESPPPPPPPPSSSDGTRWEETRGARGKGG